MCIARAVVGILVGLACAHAGMIHVDSCEGAGSRQQVLSKAMYLVANKSGMVLH